MSYQIVFEGGPLDGLITQEVFPTSSGRERIEAHVRYKRDVYVWFGESGGRLGNGAPVHEGRQNHEEQHTYERVYGDDEVARYRWVQFVREIPQKAGGKLAKGSVT